MVADAERIRLFLPLTIRVQHRRPPVALETLSVVFDFARVGLTARKGHSTLCILVLFLLLQLRFLLLSASLGCSAAVPFLLLALPVLVSI